MVRIWVCFVVLIFTGCASRPAPHSNRLVESVNIGVLKDTRIEQWQRQFVGQSVQANNVHYLDITALRQQIEAGNIDLAIGLPLSNDARKHRLWQTRPLMQREFKFITRKDDPLKLKNYLFLSSLTQRAKSIGYVSEGEPGVVNRMVVSELPNSTAFNGCGSLKRCLSELNKGSINAIFVDNALFREQINGLPPSSYVTCNLIHRQNFPVLVNQRTLVSTEFQRIDAMIN